MNITDDHLLDLLTRLCTEFSVEDGIPATEIYHLGGSGTAFGQLTSEATIEVLMELNQLREDLEEELDE